MPPNQKLPDITVAGAQSGPRGRPETSLRADGTCDRSMMGPETGPGRICTPRQRGWRRLNTLRARHVGHFHVVLAAFPVSRSGSFAAFEGCLPSVSEREATSFISSMVRCPAIRCRAGLDIFMQEILNVGTRPVGF